MDARRNIPAYVIWALALVAILMPASAATAALDMLAAAPAFITTLFGAT